MSQFQFLDGNTGEAQNKLAMSYLFKQASEGIAATGVLSGLGVTQTTTASDSVVIGAGAGPVQNSRLNGVDLLINDTDHTLPVLTGANVMGGVPRNDIVVFDQATLPSGLRIIKGTPNAVPTDPTVPSTAIPLARLRHAASATTVPTSAIDNLRTMTQLNGGLQASQSKMGKRVHWDTFTSADVNRSDATGIQTGIAHGAGFTPSAVVITPQSVALQFRAFNLTATTFDLQVINSDGSANGTTTFTYSAFFGE